ncbi:MAG: YHS domain-containing protein [Synechococcales cyanobacterium RU_4_20]|nr:YHS domain-containing protein [Synechococcales cyanobacterium RU_4_20]NJR70306.1 YHS domain-containing protein [Synechococcales cyanobacterium CRU_2_2]
MDISILGRVKLGRVKRLPVAIAIATSISLISCSQPNVSGSENAAAPGAASSTAASPAQTTASLRYYAKDGIAIGGADSVAYFSDSAYVPGSSEFTHDWNGVTWQFSSAKNRDSFAATPEAYAPQYGGFCAWAVSQGYTAEIDPTAWKIVDGKLYLNYDANIQKKWSKDIPGNITKANQNWPGVLNKG